MLRGYCVLSEYSQRAREQLAESGVELELNQGKRPGEDELKRLVRDYDVLIIGIKEKMTEAVFENVKALKILGTITNGVDHISRQFFDSPDIRVMNCPLASAGSVAEHAFGLMLALQKRLAEGNDCVVSGTGSRGLQGPPGDLYGKKLGVIGAGHIGGEVIRLAKAFRMEICCYTFNPQRYAGVYGEAVTFTSLESLLTDSDIVSVHMPLSDRTRNLVSSEKIDMMKKDGMLINTSREEIVDTRYLIRKAGQNPGFRVGLDIDTEHVPGAFSEKRYNVIVTPHIAGDSSESRSRTEDELAGRIRRYLFDGF